jgi:hypothetical protein
VALIHVEPGHHEAHEGHEGPRLVAKGWISCRSDCCSLAPPYKFFPSYSVAQRRYSYSKRLLHLVAADDENTTLPGRR